VIDVIWFLMNHDKDSGIYNLSTEKAFTFIDLVNAAFAALNLPPSIEFIRETSLLQVERIKKYSRTIPPKAEGIIPRCSAAEFGSKACPGVHIRD
jgi:nucleoside-diphosphate-sugar epimerase